MKRTLNYLREEASKVARWRDWREAPRVGTGVEQQRERIFWEVAERFRGLVRFGDIVVGERITGLGVAVRLMPRDYFSERRILQAIEAWDEFQDDESSFGNRPAIEILWRDG